MSQKYKGPEVVRRGRTVSQSAGTLFAGGTGKVGLTGGGGGGPAELRSYISDLGGGDAGRPLTPTALSEWISSKASVDSVYLAPAADGEKQYRYVLISSHAALESGNFITLRFCFIL